MTISQRNSQKISITEVPLEVLIKSSSFLSLEDIRITGKVNSLFQKLAIVFICFNSQCSDIQKYSLLRKIGTINPIIYKPLIVARIEFLNPVRALSYSKQGNLLCVLENGVFKIFDPKNQSLLTPLDPIIHIPSNSKYSDDGTKIIGIKTFDNEAIMIDSNTHQSRSLQLQSESILHSDLSPDKKLLAASSNNKITIWNTETGSITHTIELTTTTLAIGFESNNRLVFGDSQYLKVWNLAKNMLVRSQPAHVKPINCLSLSPQSRLGATGSLSGEVKIWDFDKLHFEPKTHILEFEETQTDSCKITLNAHAVEMQSIQFSPSGITLATAATDRTIKIWDTSKGTLINLIPEYSPLGNDISFSPCGSKIAGPSFNGSFRIWDLNPSLEDYVLAWLKHTIPKHQLPKSIKHLQPEEILELTAQKIIMNILSNTKIIHSFNPGFCKRVYIPQLLQELNTYPKNLLTKIIEPINAGLSDLSKSTLKGRSLTEPDAV